MAVSVRIDTHLWDLACDMAVEGVLRELNLPQLMSKPLPVLPDVQPYTAEKLYRYLPDHPMPEGKLLSWQKIYGMDDHRPWYARIAGLNSETRSDEGGSSAGFYTSMTAEQTQAWKEIAEQIQTDLEIFSKQHGDKVGKLLQSLRSLNRERTDYTAFLRRFATRTEVMRVSPDEFDYNYYTYGLSLYKDMPLIEPLEYRDDKRVQELVIAIDTSGSVAGELVQAFLQKTWNIVKQQESFSRRFTLHIIQCDAAIQEDAVLTTQEEFQNYIDHMVIRGLGGTDFRSVFEYVNRLRAEGQLRRLKGLLYFTDGYGSYPERVPDYQTAFIFLEKDDYILPLVPPWAMRVVLEENEIRMF